MEEKKQGWITEGLILASIPVLGYFFAFQYEAGYASYFQYPKIDPRWFAPDYTCNDNALDGFNHFIYACRINYDDAPEDAASLSDSIIKLLPLVGFLQGLYSFMAGNVHGPFFSYLS